MNEVIIFCITIGLLMAFVFFGIGYVVGGIYGRDIKKSLQGNINTSNSNPNSSS